MSDLTPHEAEHTDIAQTILQMWQTAPNVGHWIFITFDDRGHPTISSSIQDTVQLHSLLLQLGVQGEAMMTEKTETPLETKQ